MRWVILGAALFLATSAVAEPLPMARLDGVTVAAEVVATGFDQPVYLTAPQGDPRLFIVEKTGRIHVLADGQRSLFLDLSAAISTDSEQGLLGLAFHPDFAANQRFFVYYTDPQGTITVAEGRADDAATLTPLLRVVHDQAANHNGGWLGFGPDGLLYIGTGDGGRGGDPWGNAQNPDQGLGKILRIDVSTQPYAIPPGNPFAKGGGLPEVFALGLRNPWRATFDGDRLYIADVGQDQAEEVTILTPQDARANLGWNRVEGTSCFKPRTCDQTGLVPPIHVYDHAQGCSITGGMVYRGSAMPALRGRYLFSDFCAGTLMSFRLQGNRATDVTGMADGLASLGQVTSLGQDGMGEVYMLTLDGTIARLVPQPD